MKMGPGSELWSYSMPIRHIDYFRGNMPLLTELSARALLANRTPHPGLSPLRGEGERIVRPCSVRLRLVFARCWRRHSSPRSIQAHFACGHFVEGDDFNRWLVSQIVGKLMKDCDERFIGGVVPKIFPPMGHQHR